MATTSTSTSVLQPTATSSPGAPPIRHANAVVAFIIGLSIILLASVLNAAGLNLTKLDHVRTSALPKASRKKDWKRPLWLLGMLLYILSQLIGSTLALEYMRAEYVAPLGSSSLVFNFLFARFLVGTPVTSNDIYGTIVVVLGVIGIVAFGSINSGLASETHVGRITYLWRRGGWLGYFFFMSFALICVLIFTYSLDAVLASRSDLNSEPFSGMGSRRAVPPKTGIYAKVKSMWQRLMAWVQEKLEIWTAAKDDKQIAWTLGIGWACCGGGLAGGCLVFAKAVVKLISGSLSHENPGNQFGHAAPIFTIILLAVTAVLQIVCLNRGLKVYDSTLVVPVFYGVYTAAGFLDSLIFNDEVDSYKSWTLFLIFISITVLISGVVLLTHKKPDRTPPKTVTGQLPSLPVRKKVQGNKGDGILNHDEDGENEALRSREEGGQGGVLLWQVGDVSDDEDDHHYETTPHKQDRGQAVAGRSRQFGGEEGLALISDGTEVGDDGHGRRTSDSSDATLPRPTDPFRDDPEAFGGWGGGARMKR